MKRQSTSLMLLLLYAFLMAALLALVVSGASLYADVVQSRQANANQRDALSFVQSQIAGCRTGILLKPGPEGQMLCLPEDGTDYETRVFLHDGVLRTAFVPSDAPTDTEAAASICPASDFSLTWRTEELLEISADGAVGFAACRKGVAYEE